MDGMTPGLDLRAAIRAALTDDVMEHVGGELWGVEPAREQARAEQSRELIMAALDGPLQILEQNLQQARAAIQTPTTGAQA